MWLPPSKQLCISCVQCWPLRVHSGPPASCQTRRQPCLEPGCAQHECSTWCIIDGASNCVFPKVYRLLMKNSWHTRRWQNIQSIGSIADEGVSVPWGGQLKAGWGGAAISGTVPSSSASGCRSLGEKSTQLEAAFRVSSGRAGGGPGGLDIWGASWVTCH